MKGKRMNRPHSKTLQSYIISYVGLVLMALALLSIVVARQIAGRMEAEEIRVTGNRLNTIAENVEKQIAGIRGIALEIAAEKEFRPEYFAGDKYREVEMLSIFKAYHAMAAVSDYSFLKYAGNDTIFTSDGTTMPLKLYLERNYSAADPEAVAELIERMCAETELPLTIYKEPGAAALIIYPLKRYAMREGGAEGALCVEISESGLLEHLERFAGKQDGKLAIYYRGDILYGEDVAEGTAYMEKMSGSGNVRVTFIPDPGNYFSWDNIYTRREWGVLGAITFVLLLTAFYAAYRSWRPIRKIVEKYGESAGDSLPYELDSIDLLIDGLLSREEENSEQLKRQYRMLREQAVRMVASGVCPEGLRERMELLNLHLDAPVVCRFACVFEPSDALTRIHDKMYQEVEDLSDDDMRFYSFWEKGKLNILVAADGEYQSEEAQDALQSLFDAEGLTAEIELTEVCHDLFRTGKEDVLRAQEVGGRIETERGAGEKDIPHETERTENIGTDAEEIDGEGADGSPKAPGRKMNTAMLAMRYIEENCTRYDLSLDVVAAEFNITPTYLCRLLKEQTNVSYKEYLTGLRIAEAKKMLQNRNVSVADVCMRTGYGNVSYFIKIFQKYTGVTPAKYRDECGNTRKDTGIQDERKL